MITRVFLTMLTLAARKAEGTVPSLIRVSVAETRGLSNAVAQTATRGLERGSVLFAENRDQKWRLTQNGPR